MSREIKFRAWDGKEMHSKVCVNHEGKFIKHSYRATDWVDSAIAGIGMQCTGLRDKNGVDIYEDDLFKSEAGIWQVLFGDCDEGYVGWYAQNKSGLQWPISNDEERNNNNSIEIIGNIYENPELL